MTISILFVCLSVFLLSRGLCAVLYICICSAFVSFEGCSPTQSESFDFIYFIFLARTFLLILICTCSDSRSTCLNLYVWLSLCISLSSCLFMCFWLFVSARLSVCLSVCLSSCLYVWLTVHLYLVLSVPRPGKCPNLQPPESCIADYDECEFDDDCFPGKKCCDNSCFKRCFNPSFDPLGSSKLHCRRQPFVE